jgi:hypothetical protein
MLGEVFSDHGIHGGLFFTFAPSGKIEHSMYGFVKAKANHYFIF